tara:strand:+ start:940 stop:1143 length:204 start_codon:yes stop_codon:yes gene_type:complete
MVQTIRATVTEDGKVKFDFDGFKGTTCLEGLKKVIAEMRALGVEVEDVETHMKEPELQEHVKDRQEA